MNGIKQSIFAPVLTVLFLSSFAPASAQDNPGGSNPSGRIFLPMVAQATSTTGDQATEVTTMIVSTEEQKAAIRFWTRAKMMATEAMDMPVLAGPVEVDATAVAAAAAEVLQPGMSAAGAAAPDALQVAQAAFAEDWAELGASSVDELAEVLAPGGTSKTYTSYFGNKLAALQNLYPHTWVGRISFTTTGGTSYCSGATISGNVVVTAAHCLYDSTNNRWYSKFVFAPAYRDGSAPFGTFAATACWVLPKYVNLSGSASMDWVRYDVGVCKMGKNAAGQTLNNAVGWAGRQWNFGYVQHFHSLGYPFRNTNDQLIAGAGKYMHICVAESFQQTTDTRGMGCDMGKGKSGGPSLVNYAFGSVNVWVDGVYSAYDKGKPNMYSIRFTSNNIGELCKSAGC